VRAIGPACSSDGASGITAGIRTLPHVSVPTLPIDVRATTDAAEPPDDPPGIRSRA
jgi:hypothetical protein